MSSDLDIDFVEVRAKEILVEDGKLVEADEVLEDVDLGEVVDLVEVVELVELVVPTETSVETVVVVKLRLKVDDDKVVFENWCWK